MNPFILHFYSIITICLATSFAFSSSSSVLRVERKLPENVFQLKESTTTVEPEVVDIDDVFAIPIDDFRAFYEFDISTCFGGLPLYRNKLCWISGQETLGIVIFTKCRCRDYWYGRRLRKRSLLSSNEDIDVDKRSQYQPWGGKRARYPNIYQLPKGFNPNGGKRFDSGVSEGSIDNSRKRTKNFQNWAGKRTNNGKSFVIWGGKKRADSFRTWGGKRADSFRTWGGKRADSFRTWGGR